MTVFELAVASAIGRQKLSSDDQLCEILSDWFQRSIGRDEIGRALTRMEAQLWVRGSHGDALHRFRLTPKGVEYVATLYGGCIRMIDRGLGLLTVSYLLKFLEFPTESDA